MEQQNLAKIAAVMKSRRASLGLTQEQASEYIGISYSHYTKIENISKSPSLDTLVKICDAYHISLDQLFLKWNTPRQITPRQAEIIFDLQAIEPHQLQSCRDIMDKLLAIANDNIDA